MEKGTIKQMIDRIILLRSCGNSAIAVTVKTKIILKGINPDKYTSQTDDDPQIIRKLQDLADEFGIRL